MADYKPIVALFLEKEGGMSRAKTAKASANPAPCKITVKGSTHSDWHTNKGVTWTTFKQLAPQLGYKADCQLFADMPHDIWLKIFRHGYWTPWDLDKVRSNLVAWTVVWWSWGSGIGGAQKSLVKFLKKQGIEADSKTEITQALDTLAARMGEARLFDLMTEHRLAFYRSLDSAPANYKGWSNAYAKFAEFAKSHTTTSTGGGSSAGILAGALTLFAIVKRLFL